MCLAASDLRLNVSCPPPGPGQITRSSRYFKKAPLPYNAAAGIVAVGAGMPMTRAKWRCAAGIAVLAAGTVAVGGPQLDDKAEESTGMTWSWRPAIRRQGAALGVLRTLQSRPRFL
jgi:hypothetical protein